MYTFIIKNIIILVTLLIIILISILLEIKEINRKKYSINPNTALNLINYKDAIIIDTRSEHEFKKKHILNSINISYKQLHKQKYIIQQKKNIIIIINKTNNIAYKITKNIKQNSNKQIFFIHNGLSEWTKNKLPLIQVDEKNIPTTQN